MRVLLASTCLTPIALLASPATAQSTISTAITTPVKTSTANSGAASDVTITSTGSVKVTTPTAVTLDSANKVSNQGTIQITDVNNATGISAVAGGSGTIENAGTITIDETYAPTDTDSDGDLDGPFAQGSNRAGIRTNGAFTGSVTSTSAGKITVEGNNSYGILIGGPLTGNVSNDGTIAVTGDNAVGIKTGDVTGSIRAAGTITATGLNASAVRVDGNVSGAVVLQGTLTSTGYRYTSSSTGVLDADDLLQGGPTVSITGNVAGGVILAIPPKDNSTTNNDEDNDGIDDSKEGSAVLTSYGSAAALQIGAAGNSVTLGSVAGNTAGYGLVIDGTAAGNGVYSGVAANGVVIGGLGGNVTITNGMSVAGSITATANSGNAIGLRIGAGASVPVIAVSGSVAATGAIGSAQSSRGIVIDAGASVATIRNSGTIGAGSGANAEATAILDKSGSLTLIENSGTITATGATTVGRNVAVDLTANTVGATIRQTVVTSGAAPSITGDVLFGSGADTLDLGDGKMTGNAVFGAGANKLLLSGDATMTGNATFGSGADAMTLSGTSVFTGNADFLGGGADTLTIGGTAKFTGLLLNAQNVAVAVNGGTLNITGTPTVAIGSLAVTGGGTLAVNIDAATGMATHYVVGGAASFDANSKLAVKMSGLVSGTGHYTVLTAGSITGAGNLTTSSIALPYMYKSAISTTSAANEIAIDITRKNTTELGLNRSGASAYDAIYAALGKDTKVASAFLNISDGDAFKTAIRQMLPDHAGGTFEAVSSGSRALGRMLTDGGAPFVDKGKWGYWLQEVAWGRAKSFGNTASYDISGWGTGGGAEYKTGAGNFGLSLAYLHGSDDDNGTANTVGSDQYEAAAYWRAQWGGFRPFARVSGAKIDFSSTRQFDGNTGTTAVSLTNASKWKGTMVSATGGASYQITAGKLSFRPLVSVDYYRLDEDAHTETGGGKAFDLSIDKRSSDEFAGNATMAVGLTLGSAEDGWFHVEAEGGRRQIFGGSLGTTTARYDGGQSFTLVPDKRTDGWVARLRAGGGAAGFRLGGELGAEEQQGRAAISLRATLQIGL